MTGNKKRHNRAHNTQAAGEVTCKACGNRFTGGYCNACGEKVYTDHDRKLSHFFEEGMHFITHLDGKLFTSIKTVFTSPGRLSADYCGGVRNKYFKPLSFFLLLVVLYLIFPFFEGLNMQLKYHTRQWLYGGYAAAKIEQVRSSTGLTMEQLSDKFHTRGEKLSKFLLITIIPLTALAFYAMGFRRRKYFFDSMVFSAEINAVYLLWGFLILPLLITLVNLPGRLFGYGIIHFSEVAVGIIMYGLMCLYVARAARVFYGFGWLQSSLFAIVFFFAHIFTVYTMYKFFLFITVINQI